MALLLTRYQREICYNEGEEMPPDNANELIDAILAAEEGDRTALITEHADDLTEKLLKTLEGRVAKALESKDTPYLHRLLDIGMSIGEFLRRDDILYGAYLFKGFAFAGSDEDTAVSWFTRALEKSLVMQENTKEPYSPDSPPGMAARNIATLMHRQGLRKLGAGDYGGAASLFTSAIEYYKRLSPPTGIEYSYKFLAYAHEYAGRCDEALCFYDKALAQFEAMGNKREAAAVLTSKAGCLKTLGHYRDALSLLESAAGTYRSLDDKAMAAEISVRTADIYITSLNDYDKALEYLGSVEGSGAREQESMALMQMSAVYLAQGRYDLMLQRLKKCLALLSPPANDFERAQIFDIYSNMAEAYFLLRDFGKAEEAENNACDLAPAIKDKSGNLYLYESMGSRAFNLGLYERALNHYSKAAEIARELTDMGSAVRLLKSRGYVYLSLHSAGDALKAFGEALSLSKEHGLKYYQIDVLIAMGYGEEKEGNYEESLKLYEDALRRCGPSEEYALLAVSCRKGIAGVKAAKGETGEAIQQLLEARIIHRRRGLIRDEIYDLMELGMVAHRAHDFVKSKEFYAEALELSGGPGMTDEKINCLHGLAFADIAEERFNEAIDHLTSAGDLLDPATDRGLLMTTHYGLGISHKKSGRTIEASEHYLLAWEYMETLRGESTAEGIRVMWMTDKKTLSEEIVETFLLLGKTEEAFHYVEKGKSRVLAELLALSAVRRPGEISPEYSTNEDNLLAQARRIRRDMRNEQGSEKAPSLANELLKVTDELTLLWSSMRKAYAGSPEVEEYLGLRSGDAVSAKETVDMLKSTPGTAAIVEYFPHRERLYIFILRSDRERPFAAEIDLPEESLRLLIEQGTQKGPEKSPVSLSTLRFWELNLTKHLVDPILSMIEGCDLVYLVPYGDIVRLPLHAFKTCGGFRLIEKNEIAYAPSTTLLRFNLGNKRAGNAETLVMAFEGRHPHELLKFAYDEAARVGSVFKQGKVFLGADATEKNLFGNGRDKRIIHIVCHGEFDPDDPMNSGLYLYDSRVTADEIFREFECNADLVTLSACRTAQSAARAGDETFGLIRALFHSGASTLLVSLWNVNDERTLAFMESFYGKMKKMSVVKALTETQREMIDAEAHPYYWAPFILVGNYR